MLAAAALGIKDVGDAPVAMATDRNQTDRSRSAALKALDQLGDPRRVEAARRAGSLSGARTRTGVLRILAAADPDAAIPIIQERIDKGPMAERQGAIAAMASMQGDAARQAMLRRLDDLVAGKVPADLHLDLLEAAAARNDPAIRRKLQACLLGTSQSSVLNQETQGNKSNDDFNYVVDERPHRLILRKEPIRCDIAYPAGRSRKSPAK